MEPEDVCEGVTSTGPRLEMVLLQVDMVPMDDWSWLELYDENNENNIRKLSWLNQEGRLWVKGCNTDTDEGETDTKEDDDDNPSTPSQGQRRRQVSVSDMHAQDYSGNNCTKCMRWQGRLKQGMRSRLLHDFEQKLHSKFLSRNSLSRVLLQLQRVFSGGQFNADAEMDEDVKQEDPISRRPGNPLHIVLWRRRTRWETSIKNKY